MDSVVDLGLANEVADAAVEDAVVDVVAEEEVLVVERRVTKNGFQ